MRVRKAKCRPRDVLFARARVVYKVYVRQDNYDRAALPCSSPEGEGNCTLFNILLLNSRKWTNQRMICSLAKV